MKKTLVEQLENAAKTFATTHNGLNEDLIVAAMAIGSDLTITYIQEMEANLFQKMERFFPEQQKMRTNENNQNA